MKRLGSVTSVLTTFAVVAAMVAGAAPANAASEEGSRGKASPDRRMEAAIERGVSWLVSQQEKDGSWQHYPGITALVAKAILRKPGGPTPDERAAARRGLDFLVGLAKEDGSIHVGDLPVYNTALSLMALGEAEAKRYRAAVAKARDYLVEVQADEGEGYESSDTAYGGIGYGGDERPDLSNLQLALEALKSAELSADHELWDKAIVFLERCQNRSESNDQAWASNDGGFVYYPGHSQAGGTRSYGSMTYAGLKSFLYARVSEDDPRVRAAWEWIRKHYTVDENPGMGAQGLFYYYHTFAKALTALGTDVVEDAGGREHRWQADLAEQLLALQREDGSWVNEGSGRWWEDNPVLVTAYAVLALEEGMHGAE